MAVLLNKEDAKALAAMRRSPFMPRVQGILAAQLQTARDAFEHTAPADEELRFRVQEIKTAFNTLFVDDIVQEK